MNSSVPHIFSDNVQSAFPLSALMPTLPGGISLTTLYLEKSPAIVFWGKGHVYVSGFDINVTLAYV